MAQGNYDHPSYLTRQQFLLGRTVAGAAGTNCYFATPASNWVVRKVSAIVVTAGTSVTTNTILNGTTSIGTIAVTSAAAAGSVFTSADLNTLITAGTAISFKNGTDATCVVQVVAEANLDVAATWT
jgi:hypothetical protein